MDSYVGKEFRTEIKMISKDGEWKVSQKVTHSRSEDLKDWESRDVIFADHDPDGEVAMARTMFALSEYLKGINYDLFSVPTASTKELN